MTTTLQAPLTKLASAVKLDQQFLTKLAMQIRYAPAAFVKAAYANPRDFLQLIRLTRGTPIEKLAHTQIGPLTISYIAATNPEKRAVLDAMLGGAAIGAPLGAMKAPKGHRWEGAGRGATTGLIAGPMAGLGVLGGGAAGIGLGEAGKALNSATGGNISNPTMDKVQAALALLGVGGGGYLGTKLGLRMGRSIQSPPSWEKDEGQAKAASFTEVLTTVKALATAKQEKQAACKQMISALDAIAAKLPAVKQASIRKVQTSLSEGLDLSQALKVGYAHLPAEARGILAYKLASFAVKQAPPRKSVSVKAKDAGKAMHALSN